MSEHDPLQKLWTQQESEPFSMSLADIHARAERLQTRVRWRNWIEYGAGAIVVGAFGWTAFAADNAIVQAACGLIMLGTIYVLWKLATVARITSKAEMDAAASSWADFYRAELVRQRDALNGIWRWYLGPLVPGLVLFWIGVGLTPRTDLPWWGQPIVAAIGLGIGAAAFLGIAEMNKRAAKTLQTEIDALDRARQ